MSKQMVVMTLLFLCFLTILGFTTFSVYKLAYSGTNAFGSSSTEEQAATTKEISRAVYVGRISVSTAHLSQDHYLELSIVGFNGFGKSISINGLDGVITCTERFDQRRAETGQLPAPSLSSGGAYNPNPAPFSEFFLTVEQRFPGEVAKSLSEALRVNGNVDLNLTALNIWIAPQNQIEDRKRLPLWDGVTVQERDGLTTSNRIVMASAYDSVSGRATIGGNQ